MSQATQKTSRPRLYPPAGELWQIPGIVAAFAALLVAAYVARHPGEDTHSRDADFEALAMAYDSGDTVIAAGSAERFLARHRSPGESREAVARFVLADSRWDLASANPATTRKDVEECLALLRTAIALGLDPLYAPRALAAQGDMLLRLGQAAQALESYTQLLDSWPGERGALLNAALAYAEMNPPLMDKAQEAVARYMSIEGLAAHEAQQGYITRAQLALKGGDTDGAISAAGRVLAAGAQGETASHAALLLSRAYAASGDHAAALGAAALWDGPAAGRFEAALSLERANAMWKSGDLQAGRQALDETIFRFPGTREALSARYELASLLAGAGEIEAAKDALVSLLDDMAAQQAISAASFSIEDVSDLWVSVGRAILDRKDYTAVRDFHSAAAALMTEGHFLFFDATLYLREAEQQDPRALGLPASYAPEAAAAAAEAYRRAGEIFSVVLDTASGDLYEESLYNAGHCLYMAGEFPQAARYLRRFHEMVGGDERVPRARFEEADALAAMGNTAAAIAACRATAEEHPTNVYAYRAMLLEADLNRAMGSTGFEEAARIYGGILTDARFHVDSAEWRRAIFSLGRTLYDLGRYRDAVLRIEEALARFPGDAEAAEARYLLGLSCRQAAFEEARLRQEFLSRAALIFAGIAAEDEDRHRSRSAAFLEADCYYQLAQYERALALYDRAVEANVDTPEATAALFQIANCYHRLGRREQAEATYRRAVFSLRRGERVPEPGASFYEALASWRGTGGSEG